MKINTEYNVKMALFQQDLVATMQDRDAWKIFVDEIVKSDPDGQACADFEKTYGRWQWLATRTRCTVSFI